MRRMFLILFLFAIIACACAPPAYEEATPDLPESAFDGDTAEIIEDTRYGRSFLSPIGKEIYDKLDILASNVDGDSDITVPAEYTQGDVEKLFTYFLDDNPEFFWLKPLYTVDDKTGRRSISISIANNRSRDGVLSDIADIRAAAAPLLENLPEDEADRVTELHDRLARHITYDTQTGGRSNMTIYGGLVNKAGICDAYSKSFQYLAMRAGIPCVYLKGTNARGVPHSWNAVKLDGSWYYVDVTWDDKENLRHDYLCIDSEALFREHRPSAGQYPSLPECESGEFDYFYRGGYLISESGDAQTLEALSRAFAAQISQRGMLENYSNPVFLEVKISGDPARYKYVKNLFFQNVFTVLDRMEIILTEENSPVTIDRQNSVSCGSGDNMQVLNFFPFII